MVEVVFCVTSATVWEKLFVVPVTKAKKIQVSGSNSVACKLCYRLGELICCYGNKRQEDTSGW